MRVAPEIKHLSDVELLEHVCSDADDTYYTEFVNRYLGIVQEKCEGICKRRRLDNHLGLEIAHDTFERLRRSRSFKREKLKKGDERAGITGFLYRISINLFNDHHNAKKHDDVVLPSYLDAFSQRANESVNALDAQSTVRYTQRILSKLNSKERRVLLIDLEYKRHKRYLPDEVVDSLCEELKIKRSSLRKIRERLNFKVQTEIDLINGEQ